MNSLEFHIREKKKGKKADIVIGELLFMHGDECIRQFPANSGGWGNGPLPVGEYKCHSARPLPSGSPDGLGTWIMGIEPLFQTSRYNLAIHKDGGVPGTLGCIGITEDDLKCFELLRTHAPKRLRVYDSRNT
jgi:hypothetical protein